MIFFICHIRRVILFVLLLAPSTLISQKSPLIIKSKCNSWRGIEISDDSEALCLSGKGIIQEVYVDSVHSILYALLRDSKKGKLQKTGNVVAYDFKEDRELWTTPFDFKNDRFFLSTTFPVKSGIYQSVGIDRNSGEEVWKVDMQIGLVTKDGVGVAKGYKALVGLDLRNGKVLWQKPATFDEIGTFELHGDTAGVFLNKGLNFINLNTGEGFKIAARTLERPGGMGMSVGGSIAMGIVSGVMLGMVGVSVLIIPNSSAYAAQRSDHSLTDMSMHKDGIIFTSLTEFYNVKYNGDIAWSVPIDKSMGSIRKVFVANDASFVISKGIIQTENGPIYSPAMLYRMGLSGKDSLIGIRLDTGTREYMQDFLVKDSTIVIALNNRIVEIRLDDLSTIQNQSFGISDQNVGFGTILNPPSILFTDSIFEMASEKYPNDFFVANKGGMKIRFSEELSPVEVIRQPNYFALSQELSEKRMFVTNGTDIYLINASGKKLIDLSFSPQMQYIGGRVFDYEDNRILGIKL